MMKTIFIKDTNFTFILGFINGYTLFGAGEAYQSVQEYKESKESEPESD